MRVQPRGFLVYHQLKTVLIVSLLIAFATLHVSAQARPANAHVSTRHSSLIYVQVAALKEEENASVIATALMKRDYPAFVEVDDDRSHVLVGPLYPNAAAGIMKRLKEDGYNPVELTGRRLGFKKFVGVWDWITCKDDKVTSYVEFHIRSE